MSSDKIKNYYLLCTVRLGKKSHIVNNIPAANIEIIFTKKEINLFLRQVDGHYIAREVVVGGQQLTHSTGRPPIIVIGP